MVKPFSPRELTARVKAVLRRSGGAAAGNETATQHEPGHPFTVDHKRLLISYFGQKLEMSRYEYLLLELLVKRPVWRSSCWAW